MHDQPAPVCIIRAYQHPHDPTVCVLDYQDERGLMGTKNVPWDERPVIAQRTWFANPYAR